MAQLDPRDEGRPGEKEWQEFRVTFAGALLHLWLVRDLEEMRPHYRDELKERIGDAIGTIYVMREEDPTVSEGPIQGPEWRSADFWDLASLELLEDQLFPKGTGPDDAAFIARGLVVVGLHAALESYFSSRFPRSGRKPLYRSIEDVITSAGLTFPASLFSRSRGLRRDTTSHCAFPRRCHGPVRAERGRQLLPARPVSIPREHRPSQVRFSGLGVRRSAS